MRRMSWPSFAAGALASAVLVGAPATGLVRGEAVRPEPVDNGAPSLTVSPARFVAWASIDAAAPPGGDPCAAPTLWNAAIPLKVTWRASDPSGIDGYDVWGAGPEVGYGRLMVGTSATEYTFLGGNVDVTRCGPGAGGSPTDDVYWVAATDAAGNAAQSRRGSAAEWVDVWQEDGSPPAGPGPGGAGALAVSSTGTWSTATCPCANGGTTTWSDERGATLFYELRTDRPGQTVALVAATGPDHGRAYVRVDDGVFRAVNLTAGRSRDRVIVWQQTLPPGEHRLEVVNAGSKQRPRLEVDSVLLTRAAAVR